LARQTNRSQVRRERRERSVARPEATVSSVNAAAELEACRRVVDALAGLDDPYRTALVLRYFDGLALREIAEPLGAGVPTVGRWLRRGLALLRTRLGEKDDDWRAALLPLLTVPRSPIRLGPLVGGVAMTSKKAFMLGAVLLLLSGSMAWQVLG